jgi:hypothetical protein
MEAIVSAIFGFFAGWITTKITINAENDREKCKVVIDMIDNIVESFHSRFSSSKDKQIIGEALFDYHIKSLVDDTTILPIIGRNAFDGEYTRLIGNIYKLTLNSPSEMSKDLKEIASIEINNNAVDLKKIININRKDWRIARRI